MYMFGVCVCVCCNCATHVLPYVAALLLLFVAWWTWWMFIDIVVDIDVCIGIAVFKNYIDV